MSQHIWKSSVKDWSNIFSVKWLLALYTLNCTLLTRKTCGFEDCLPLMHAELVTFWVNSECWHQYSALLSDLSMLLNCINRIEIWFRLSTTSVKPLQNLDRHAHESLYVQQWTWLYICKMRGEKNGIGLQLSLWKQLSKVPNIRLTAWIDQSGCMWSRDEAAESLDFKNIIDCFEVS